MLGVKGPMPDCPLEKECLKWAHTYLKDCVCNFRDEISLALGLISVFSWGVAEVPQIMTNFKEKSTEGVSLAFLMTWVVGDIFNLAGCYLEPATLPTQFYMAVLYTFTTIILVGQTIYYDYLYLYFHPELKYEPIEEPSEKPAKSDVEAQKPTLEPRPIKEVSGASSPESGSPLTSTINVPLRGHRTSSRDLYYMSARSLASSHTPTVGSYLAHSGSRESVGQGHGFLRPSHGSTVQDHVHGSISRADSISSISAGSLARAAAASILLVGGSVGLSSNVLSGGSVLSPAGQLLRAGRSLLQTSGSRGDYFPVFPKRSYIGEAQAEGPWGEIAGWLMAAIYMGGRLPQIILNSKRGTVEGLNPLMFVFALVGNTTYVASILVRSLDWVLIKPNMPWLVDAAVCVFLDCFIIGQFFYYKYGTREGSESEEEEDMKGSYEAIR